MPRIYTADVEESIKYIIYSHFELYQKMPSGVYTLFLHVCMHNVQVAVMFTVPPKIKLN